MSYEHPYCVVSLGKGGIRHYARRYSKKSLYPLQTSENLVVFWCFQLIEKGCIRKKLVKFQKFLPTKVKNVKNIFQIFSMFVLNVSNWSCRSRNGTRASCSSIVTNKKSEQCTMSHVSKASLFDSTTEKQMGLEKFSNLSTFILLIQRRPTVFQQFTFQKVLWHLH